MAQQSFIWTALPNNYTLDKKSLRLSVMLSPRLDPVQPDPLHPSPEKLGSFFPDWKDWPSTIKKAVFEIHYGNQLVSIPGDQTTGLNCVDTTLGTPDTEVWQALFHENVFVRGFQFTDLSDNLVLSYDTVSLKSLIQNLYGNLAKNVNGDTMPHVSDFTDDPVWNNLINTVQGIDRQFDQNGHRWIDDKYFQNLIKEQTDTLTRFQLYHTPPQKPQVKEHTRQDDSRITAKWTQYERQKMPSADELAKAIDFHQIISAMNQYPIMLRKLGIVIDFIIDATSFTQAQDILSVNVIFPPGLLKVERSKNDVSPVTHTLLSTTRFEAISNPNLIDSDTSVKNGLLDMNTQQYDIIQFDVDGAGFKLMNFTRTLSRHLPESERMDSVNRFEKEMGAPSLRNAGLMLVHHNRGNMLQNRLGTNNDKNTIAENGFKGISTPLDLWAEDLVRGYRFDVWDSNTSIWRSLCEREVSYILNGGSIIVKPLDKWEEGVVRLAATKSSDPKKYTVAYNGKVIYLHEALISWTGWSLVVPPLGRAIDRKDEVDKTVTQTEPDVLSELKFKTTFKVKPNSLPRLRLGRGYRVRARVVDLAGNSIPPQEADFGSENPESKRYLRYDPVLAPVIALLRPEGKDTEKPAEGESMERIAIRSFNNQPDDNSIPTWQFARRVAVPPQSSAKDAELHGMLDAASGGLDKSMFEILANQKDLNATDPNAALEGEIVTNTNYAVYNDGKELTYLPDPMAEEVAVRIFDHPYIADTEVITIPLYPDPVDRWPEARIFKIQVFEDPIDPTAKPKFDAAQHTLLIPLPKAIRARVRLSMKLSDKWLAMMGIWNWLSDNDRRSLGEMVKLGKHWMLTPWRELEVVNAVQRPLIQPQILYLKAQRNYAATSCKLELVTTCSIKSTDKLDLLAEWHEPKDNASEEESKATLVDHKRGDLAFSIKITDPKSYAMESLGHKYGGFAEHTIISEDVITVNKGKQDGRAPKTHEFHDTRYRRIEYWFEGTSKFREYMPANLIKDENTGASIDKNIKVVGPRLVSWIPSSAPPPAPEVLYVVPTFGWVRPVGENGNRAIWRRGGGLRVYLNRPWNVSGYGEMLAVVLPPIDFSGDVNTQPNKRPYKTRVTQWGNDPIWRSPFVSGIAPKRTDFPLSRTSPDNSGLWLHKNAPPEEKDQRPGLFRTEGLPAPGGPFYLTDGLVEIAPHDVFYDEDRRLWYCDIEINQGTAYYPFIRLALARYQPMSLDTQEIRTHLSDVVLADFMQLTPDRWLNLTTTNNSKKIHITLYGNHYNSSSNYNESRNAPSKSIVNPVTHKPHTITPADISGTSVIEVWIERLDKELGTDFGWERIDDINTKSNHILANIIENIPNNMYDNLRVQELLKKRNFDSIIKENLIQKIFPYMPLWDGDITLPDIQGTDVHYRIVVAEYEEYIVDDDLPYDDTPEKKDRRIVFVEHVELS